MKKKHLYLLFTRQFRIQKIVILLLLNMVFFLTSCNLTDPDNETNNDPTPATPYFTFKIEDNQSVTVNCEALNFVAAAGGEHIQSFFGTSQSVNSTFSFAFYGSSAIMDTLNTGEYPLIAYTGWASTIPMHFSLKVPRTTGESDYYLTIDSTSPDHNHIIESIEKRDLENGMRVYNVTGSYNLKAENIIDNEIVDISGEYFFKLLTLEE